MTDRGSVIGTFATTLLAAAVSAAPAHWYEKPQCLAAQAEVMTFETSRIDAAITSLEKRGDLDSIVCARWLEIARGNAELALEGKSKALAERRGQRLDALYKLAMRHGRRNEELRDLAIEAHLFRVRLLVETGEKKQALEEARAVEKMLSSREGAPKTASRTYARAVTDMAVGGMSLPVRLLFKMANVSGDEDRGRAALEELAAGRTVYAAEARVLLHFFARANDDASSARLDRYGAAMAAALPMNPQVAFDRARDLSATGRCPEALRVLEPVQGRLGAEPQLWTPRIRKKLHWITARCAYETGDVARARSQLSLASTQTYGGHGKDVAALQKLLDGSGR